MESFDGFTEAVVIAGDAVTEWLRDVLRDVGSGLVGVAAPCNVDDKRVAGDIEPELAEWSEREVFAFKDAVKVRMPAASKRLRFHFTDDASTGDFLIPELRTAEFGEGGVELVDALFEREVGGPDGDSQEAVLTRAEKTGDVASDHAGPEGGTRLAESVSAMVRSDGYSVGILLVTNDPGVLAASLETAEPPRMGEY